jgi:murein DD-endopeptidase MepM/ murein hydrolase activator NlpD
VLHIRPRLIRAEQFRATERLGTTRSRLRDVRMQAGSVRDWLSAAMAAAAISGLGVALAAVTDLTAPPVSEAVTRPVRAAPPLEPYDRARGAAPDLRLNTPAQTKVLALQRRYELALDHQLVAEAVADAYRERRRRALQDAVKETEERQVQLFEDQERRRIEALVAKELAKQLQAARQEAESEAAEQRENGLEPPAAQEDFPATSEGGAMPVASGVIGASFGAVGMWSSYHTGVDFRAGYGEPVYAAAPGVVVYAGNRGDWAGNHVAIRHSGGITTMSSHLSSIGVSVGQSVRAGQTIGRVGQTGRAFGAHLHFEVYPAGVRPGDVYQAVDPVPWLSSRGVAVR